MSRILKTDVSLSRSNVSCSRPLYMSLLLLLYKNVNILITSRLSGELNNGSFLCGFDELLEN